MSKVVTAEQAAALIPDGAVVGAAASGLACWPQEVAEALGKRFQETGRPRGLTLLHSTAIGDWKQRGTVVMAFEGLIKRWIGGHVASSVPLAKLASEGKIEAYCLPQGVILNLLRALARREKGVLTKIGLGTFVDPRVEGGKMNSATHEDIVKVVQFEGEEYLWFKTVPVDVALIRGTTADENGNLSMEKESIMTEALLLAQGVRNNGGIVIAQAEYLAKRGSLHPKHVIVPGICVDYVVIATKPESQWQTEGCYFNPAFNGDVRVPLSSVPELPLDDTKIIARRAAMQLYPNIVVNLGIGVPSSVANIAVEENCSDLMTLTTETGAIGGVPASRPHFGNAYNPEAVIRHEAQMDFYDGGGIDVTCLGMAEVDRQGNVNVSKFNGRTVGCGGFVNISQAAKEVVFAGSFTAGGLKVTAQSGKLVIQEEGRNNKFVERVEQVTFSGKYAIQVKKPPLYVTERAVFTIQNEELTLVEVAPGIDLEKHVLAHMNFRPRIAANLKLMDPGIFWAKWGGLRTIIENRVKARVAGA